MMFGLHDELAEEVRRLKTENNQLRAAVQSWVDRDVAHQKVHATLREERDALKAELNNARTLDLAGQQMVDREDENQRLRAQLSSRGITELVTLFTELREALEARATVWETGGGWGGVGKSCAEEVRALLAKLPKATT